MSNRGLMGISIVSGLVAVIIFIVVISAFAGSHGPAPGVTVVATPGQPVDSEQVYGPPGGAAPAQAAPTVQPVQQSQQGQAGGGQGSTVEAPAASAPPNPFTAGIH